MARRDDMARGPQGFAPPSVYSTVFAVGRDDIGFCALRCCIGHSAASGWLQIPWNSSVLMGEITMLKVPCAEFDPAGMRNHSGTCASATPNCWCAGLWSEVLMERASTVRWSIYSSLSTSHIFGTVINLLCEGYHWLSLISICLLTLSGSLCLLAAGMQLSTTEYWLFFPMYVACHIGGLAESPCHRCLCSLFQCGIYSFRMIHMGICLELLWSEPLIYASV